MDFINKTSSFTIMLTIMMLLISPASFSKNMKVYKHVDKNGIIHYSSKKPVGKSYNILNVRCPECSEWRNSVNWSNTPLITDKFNLEIDSAARKHGLEPALIKAVIHAESAFKPEVISSAGAQGLMQLMPLTQKTYQVNNPYDPLQNIHGGSAYLKHLKTVYSNIDVYLAAYNSGETAVEKYGRAIPPFPETREYVRRVKILYSRYKSSARLNTESQSTKPLSINAASR